ncbi:MAG: zf-HC2 domain-containing protein [Candidatus Lambdaproteobacteria bacterium]|nr:zf-HC2 domain-containing protein [Candidatus Lambdaproteobacteria bacterium]
MNALIGPCDDVRDFLLDYLDQSLPPLRRLRFSLHLRMCPRCQAYLARYRSGVEFAKQSLAEAPPPELVELTLKFLDERLPSPPPPGGRKGE